MGCATVFSLIAQGVHLVELINGTDLLFGGMALWT
jgi:hypothetical protein